jgi:menaquinone-dependent protoporphyrinogen IX oxidase
VPVEERVAVFDNDDTLWRRGPRGAVGRLPALGSLGWLDRRGASVTSASEVGAAKPRVLLVYYTYTQQSLRVVEAMADVLRERGCDVRQAGIEFIDKRWAERFSRLPLRHAYRDILGMLPAQLRGATGEIRVPDDARQGDYDLICIGSPTWFFKPSVPIRSYLKSQEARRILEGKRFTAFVVCRRYWSINLKAVKKLGTQQGGEYVDGIHFSFAGGQVRSLLSLLSYFGKGENRTRYLGLKIPPSLLTPDYAEKAGVFANELADGLGARRIDVAKKEEDR